MIRFEDHSRRRIAAAVLLAIALAGCSAAPGTVGPSSSGEPAGSPASPSAAASTESPTAPSPTVTGSPTLPPTIPPTVAPTLRPSAAPTVAPTPTSPVVLASRLVSHGSRTTKRVALTYDMGGRVGDALAIMSWLVAHEMHASVFMTGAMADNANTDAGRTVLGIIEAHPDLFTLGNHSYTHRDFRTLTAAEIRDELRRTEAAIAPYCSQDLRPFFRPPSVGYDAEVLAAVGAAGYRDTVTWDVDTIDWRPVNNDPPGPTTDQIVAKVLANAQNGSIVLNHLGGYNTYAALPRVVAGLRAAGYELVTLDELFAMR